MTANRNSPWPSYDQLSEPELLRRAWRLVQQGGPAGGVDAVDLDQFRRRAGSELPGIAAQLAAGQYRFQPVRRALIRKLTGGHRRLGIPTIADRFVGQAIRLILEPKIEPALASASFAYRAGRDVHQAIGELRAQRDRGQTWCLESDVADFFDSIAHPRLLEMLRQHVRDPRLLDFIRQHLQAGIRSGKRIFRTRRGVAQGSPLSPLLSNLYLDPFDRALVGRGYALVRYADDFVVCCRSRQQAEQARRDVEMELQRLGLRIQPGKTRVVDARREPLEFLGFLVHPLYLWPAPDAVQRFRDQVQRLTGDRGDVPFQDLIGRINPLVRSFAHYYAACRVVGLYSQLDAFVRSCVKPHLQRAGRRVQRSQDQWRALNQVSMSEILFRKVPDPPPRMGYGWDARLPRKNARSGKS